MVLLLAMQAGCENSPDRESAVVNPQTPARAATSQSPGPVAVGEPCPATGEWAICSIEKRLKRSGFVPQKIEGDTARRPGFSVKPVAYTLGHGRIELFIYDDEAALTKDLANLDSLTVSPRGTPGSWPSEPKLIRSANLAAVYMAQTPRQAERLELAITAGAPAAR
jgi:hypothetical protein